MASTSTNKQPLLIDRPLHKVYNLSRAITGSAIPGEANATIDITGTNTAIPVVNCIQTDGAICEDFYLISRSTTSYQVNLYFSTQSDFLRSDSIFIGSLATGTTGQGELVHWRNAPVTLAPVPQYQAQLQAEPGGDTLYQGNVNSFQALYIPTGTCLWAGIQISAEVTDGPIAGFSGGFY